MNLLDLRVDISGGGLDGGHGDTTHGATLSSGGQEPRLYAYPIPISRRDLLKKLSKGIKITRQSIPNRGTARRVGNGFFRARHAVTEVARQPGCSTATIYR
jgi:hypothetical protein